MFLRYCPLPSQNPSRSHLSYLLPTVADDPKRTYQDSNFPSAQVAWGRGLHGWMAPALMACDLQLPPSSLVVTRAGQEVST